MGSSLTAAASIDRARDGSIDRTGVSVGSARARARGTATSTATARRRGRKRGDGGGGGGGGTRATESRRVRVARIGPRRSRASRRVASRRRTVDDGRARADERSAERGAGSARTSNASSNCSHGRGSHVGYASSAAASLYAPGTPW
eukprot:477-Pelagococcus_subviridis.AAC.1